jgi:hypothetical protein
MATKSKKKPEKTAKVKVSAQTRLALDRFLMGLWIERDLVFFLSAKPDDGAPLRSIIHAANTERTREAERLHKDLFGSARPTALEQFEALLRQGVDCVETAKPVLKELQHDLYASADAVSRDDLRAEAMRALGDYAIASQVNVAVQEVGHLAEVTTDRVSLARTAALRRLKDLLSGFPHLMPAGG